MKKIYHAFAICCVSAGLLTACSSNDNDDKGTVTDTETKTLSDKYQGNYAIACAADGEGGSVTQSLTVTGLVTTTTETSFSDAQCVTPVETRSASANISFPGGTQTTARGEADFVNTTLTELKFNGEVQDPTGLTAANRMQFNIVLLDGVNLYLGDTDTGDAGDTETTRATTLEQIPFVRQ